ncbi:serine protease [Streptacidiphilus sp. P02-A3a]|uniref:trypsin-like serine peptidase n=1 Tax=Streptacidiphilus sp. P02-A3a TaxID=2704468 RepID=UPI0015FCB2D2|nr:trypsin-like peptidase domain-containing protein [Streptacidiphilus sp. P02-A3a]QMU68237.1 trypsin-like serine protease [Streptacidiphilus sp. P02-A3a]
MSQTQFRILARTLGVLAFGVCFALVLDYTTGSRSDQLSTTPLSATHRSLPVPVLAPVGAPAQVPAVVGGAGATPGTSSSAFVGMPMIGAVFPTGEGVHPGDHYCTASVVDSPGGDLIATAAHCVDDPGNGSTAPAPFLFVPGYHDGLAPYGEWTPVKVLIDPHWSSNSNPDYDIAFAVVQEVGHPKARLADMVGSEGISFDTRLPAVVSGFGYPASSEQPIACLNTLKPFQPTQSEFDCAGFANGSSGGPLLLGVAPGTGRGSLVGVIGGYEEGGLTPEVSYAAAFGGSVQALYRQAAAVPIPNSS